MFPRVVTATRGGRTYRYLTLVESYREAGKTKQRVVGNLGNIDHYSDEEIRRLILKLRSFLHDPDFGTLDDLDTDETKEFGVPYVVKVFWDRLGLTRAIQAALRDRDVQVDVALCTLAMVMGRLLDPQSKRATHEWLPEIYLPELETGVPPLQHLYRTLDYLVEAKEPLEDHIYGQLRDLLNLVFYDVTSTYFEGDHCPLAEYGYSRDHRPDRKQITIGLLVTPEGLPIAHEVFRGGTVDNTTVPGVLERLQKRFGIPSCIFVGDRGMITAENLQRLHEAGYPYVLGYHKRGRAFSDQLLAEHTDLTTYTEGPDGLRYKEIPLATDPEDGSPLPGTARTLLCYNEAKAQEDRAFREAALAEAEAALRDLQQRLATQDRRRGRKLTSKGVMLRVAEILSHKGVAKFFQVAYDGRELRFERDEAAIAKEALRDGKFLVQTSADLSPWDVIRAYKNLQRVETAFRELKDFLRIRPIYH